MRVRNFLVLVSHTFFGTLISGLHCREDVNTYRPIAVLLTIAQDFQRFIFEQFNAYFNENEFLYSHQSVIDTNV